MHVYEFNAVRRRPETGDEDFSEIPWRFPVETRIKGKVKFTTSFDGTECRASLTRMGYGAHCPGLYRRK
ncbi:MAG: hypothetical protein QHH06_14310 [Clostridiales bacterium]|jgi:hypothetical protein|nr:hypothetical protein [Eubacteriales bacterium]MDH7567616.1 hypothetical protein [Clostridiales bacterium]